MSLVHWWPLNGNLRDYVGCNHLTVVNNNNKLQSNNLGLLGKCWERTTVGTTDILRSTNKMAVFTEQSICAWIYVSQHAATDTANGVVSNHSHNDKSGLGIGVFVSKDDTTKYYVSINAGCKTDRIHSSASGRGRTNIKGSWHHVCITYASDKKIRLYVDGVEDMTPLSYNVYSISDYLDVFNWSTTHYTNNSYRPVCKVCDVRVYDHALSVAEVKELSKGLMIHYAFNDTGNETTINLLPSNQQTQSNSAATIEVTSGLTQGGTYTLSTYITRQPECTSTNPRLTIRFFYSDGTSTAASKYNDGGTSYPKDGVERFYFITATANASKTLTKIGGWLMDHTNGTGKKMTATKSQLELSDHPTTYTPISRACIAFDDSGNGYDANGYNIVMNTNTNNGTLSAKFNGSTSYYEVPVPRSNMFSTPYTLSFWVNPADNDRAIYFGDHQTTGGVSMNFERKSGGKTRYYHGGSPDKEFNTTAPANTWTMITITSDGTNMRAYENGVLKETYKFTPTIQKPSGHMRIGRDSRSDYTALAGYISDFRWYATALSDEDIKILYESKAAVDKTSNFYTNEFIEVNTSTVDVTNKYTIKTNEIIEGQENGFYKDGHMTSNKIYEI